MCTKNHDHMMYASWDMEYKRPNFLSFWAIFCSFTPLLTPKIKNWKKLQKTGDIILLHWCTINEVNIVYGSWDIRHNKQSFLLFWVIFCPLTFQTTWKIKTLKKWKKCLRILSFYTCIPQMMIIWCMVPKIWSTTDRIFVISDYFLPFYPPNNLENQNFEKLKKMPVDIIILHMCTINENHMMYVSWDMEHIRHNIFSFWTIFYPFTSLTTQKIKILKKSKKCLKILLFHTSVP